MLKSLFIQLFFIFFFTNSYAQLWNQPAYYNDSSQYDVNYYEINLNVTSSSTYLDGFSKTVAKTVNKPLKKFFIELNDSLTVDSILINKQKQDFFHNENWIKIYLENEIPTNQNFEVIIFYKGTPVNARPGWGINSSDIFESNILYTLSEPFYSSEFFPCKQWVSDKIDSVTACYTVPNDLVPVANGLLKEKKRLSNGKTFYKWSTHYLLSYYLIAVTVGNYKEYSYKFFDELYKDSLLFQNFVYNDDEFFKASKSDIDTTIEIIKTYEKITGIAYPFRKEKYGHVNAPIGGGMENQTVTTLSDFGFELVAHELAHSWFGDLVTCANWQHIWVNEGITSYMEFLAYEKLHPDLAQNWLMGASARAMDDLDGQVYVPYDDRYNSRRIFNYNLTYRKGALIMHMLRRKINDDQKFFTILNRYLTQYAFSNATADDFRDVAEEVTGLNLHLFFYQWYYSKGFPVVLLDWKIVDNNLNISVLQSGSSLANPIFDFDLDIITKLDNGKDSLLTLRINNMYHEFDFTFATKPLNIQVNPNYNLLAAIKTTPDALDVEKSLTSEEQKLKAFPNPCNDSITLIMPADVTDKTIRILNLQGKVVKEWNTSKNEMNINTSNILPGMYIVNYNDGQYSSSIKFQKL